MARRSRSARSPPRARTPSGRRQKACTCLCRRRRAPRLRMRSCDAARAWRAERSRFAPRVKALRCVARLHSRCERGVRRASCARGAAVLGRARGCESGLVPASCPQHARRAPQHARGTTPPADARARQHSTQHPASCRASFTLLEPRPCSTTRCASLLAKHPTSPSTGCMTQSL